MASQIEFLKTTAYFSGLGTADLDAIAKHVFEKAVSRGQNILYEGEPAKELYFVTSGVVKVFKTSADGKEQILSLVRPGESFNDVPVYDGKPNMAGALAMGNVALYGLKKTDMEVILKNYPRAALNTIKVLCQRVEQMGLLVEDLSFRHVTSRVAKILLEYVTDGTGQKARLTQQDMAALAGTAREMVGRSLKALESEGKIRLDRHRIVITDVEALKEVAGVAG